MAGSVTVRRARKMHRCTSCERPVRPGERYLSWTAFPNNPALGNWGQFVRGAECGDCADHYGRAIPDGVA